MAYFSMEVATTLQYFTFPLEVVGLTFAAIEVRFPDKAKLIARIVQFQDRNTTLGSLRERWPRVVLLAILMVASIALSWSITLIAVVFSAITFLMIRLTSRWVPDRSVGTLGIVIAGFGVLGEAYQLTTQLVV
jgi:hypothetical protein